VGNPGVLFIRPKLILESLYSRAHCVGNWLSESTRGHITDGHATNIKGKHRYCEYIWWNLIWCHVRGKWDNFHPVFANLFYELRADSKLEQVNADSNILHTWVSWERHDHNLVLKVGARCNELYKITIQTLRSKIIDREACDCTCCDFALGLHCYNLVSFSGRSQAAAIMHTDNKLQIEGLAQEIGVYFEN